MSIVKVLFGNCCALSFVCYCLYLFWGGVLILGVGYTL